MPIQLTKKKYKKDEVQAIVARLETEFETKLIEQRNKIKDLVRANNDFRTKIEEYTEKEASIINALIKAEQIAEDAKCKSEELYQLEIERLKKFAEKWNGYFKELKEKYPLYPVAKQAIDIRDTLVETNDSAKNIVEILDGKISSKESKKKVFDPKSKIEDYIAATSDNGFNMEEVLNPGALKLEEICKELGLIEEE